MAVSPLAFIFVLIVHLPAVSSHDCGSHCPCYMEGVYYGHGDEWDDRDRPCVRYKCFYGYFREIKRGILFHGNCYQPGDEWTYGCNTYEGKTNGRFSYFRLTEGGCADDEGDCWAVGETREWNCVVRQCQIVDGCFKVVQIYAGCSTNEGCQRIESHWHDGCHVYECQEHNGHAHVEKLHDEHVMDWPAGSYGMLKPNTGCPKNDIETWEEGSRLHYSNGSNSWSFALSLGGDYKKDFFNQHYCIHTKNRQGVNHVIYHTYWEPGAYCILKYNATCCKGFHEGFVRTQDVVSPGKISGINGTLPDGEYGEDFTTIKFCCRTDGSLDHPVVLPMREPFVLFMVQGANRCQKVRGMDDEIQYFRFDDGESENVTKSGGIMPEVKHLNGDTMMYFCYYKPAECGCKDKDGDYIPLFEKIKEGCSTWRCVLGVNKRGEEKPVLELYEGGCETLEGCKAYGTSWTEMEGETCSNYTCDSLYNGSSVQLVINKTSQGCRDNDACRPLGHILGDGCFEMACIREAIGGMPYYSAVKPGCKDFEGNCVALDSMQMKNCSLYQCQQHRGRFTLIPIETGCETENGCVKNLHNITKGCEVLQCKTRFHNKEVVWKMQRVLRGCWWKGQCLLHEATQTIKKTTKFACFQLRCIPFGNANIALTVGRECRDSNGDCIKPDQTMGLLKYKKQQYNDCTCNVKKGRISALCRSPNERKKTKKKSQGNKGSQNTSSNKELILSDDTSTEDQGQLTSKEHSEENSASRIQDKLESRSVEDEFSDNEGSRGSNKRKGKGGKSNEDDKKSKDEKGSSSRGKQSEVSDDNSRPVSDEDSIPGDIDDEQNSTPLKQKQKGKKDKQKTAKRNK